MAGEKALSPVFEGPEIQVKTRSGVDPPEAQVQLPEPIPKHTAFPTLYTAGDSRGKRKEAKCFLRNMLSVAKH